MSSVIVGLVSTGCLFSGAVAGIWLQGRLPRHHLDQNSKDVVNVCGGMLATISALVLGLLVSSAKSTFDSVNDGVKQGSAKIILLDRVLAQYGPEAKPVREQLKGAVIAGIEAARARRAGRPSAPAGPSRAEAIGKLLWQLAPQSDSQRQLFTQAQQIVADLAQSRWLMMEEEQNELPTPLLVILIGWLTGLFVSFGLFAPRNATVFTVLFIGACSMSAAIFLVLELNRPMSGCIHISTAPVRDLMQQLGR